uniref:Guanylate cyclase n=1 Tax=Tetranychus urticae TaxID=32264 RepID=T1KKV6_TETUR
MLTIYFYLLIQCSIVESIVPSRCIDVDRLENKINPNYLNITVGFLSSFKGYGLGKEISGAIPLAIDQINRDPQLLPNHTLDFIAMDAGQPNTATSIRMMTEMREQGVVAFIGPENSCVSEALVATAWNYPMITYVSTMPCCGIKCADRTVSDKSVYATFARTLPPGSKVSKSIISLLKHFNWNKVSQLAFMVIFCKFVSIFLVIVGDQSLRRFNNNPTDRQVEEALIALAAQHGIQINNTYYLPSYYLTKHKTKLEEIIEDSYAKTRIYVLISDIEAVADYAYLMQQRNLLTTGDYAIISIEDEVVYAPEKQENYFQMFETWLNQANIREVSNFDPNLSFPFRAVFIVTPSAPINPDYDKFKRQVNCRNGMDPFNVPLHDLLEPDVPIYAGLAYDAVMIYAMAVTQLINDGSDYTNGTLVVEYIKNARYRSILGFDVTIDENGDAEGNYTLLALLDNPKAIWYNKTTWNKTMQPVGRFTYQKGLGLPSLSLEHQIDWIGGEPPASEPYCGFDGEKCIHKPDWIVIVSSFAGSLVLIVVFSLAFRHYRYEYKLACLLWKVDMKELILLKTNSEYTIQNLRNTINFHGLDPYRFSAFISAQSGSNRNSKGIHTDGSDGENDEMFANGIGFYKGNVVFIKRIYKKSIDLTRNVRKELIQIREMRHENINPFIGACVDAPNVTILKLYCARGSLEDVLKNQDLDLDNMFIASLVADLIKGMIYLHDSYIISHGNLKSSNCLVDSRWVLQITDFGLHEFQQGQEFPPEYAEKRERGLLWQAPELLRQINPPSRGTQKGDIYSFAIILFEIIGRKGPWGISELSVRSILDRVKYPSQYGGHIFRPPLNALQCPEYVKKCIRDCWYEDPEVRPDFRFINIQLRDMQAGLKPNIFDNMIAIMEKYAYNLEGLVQERTNQLVEEKKKTENLLLRMLPKPVAEQLKRGQPVEAESFDSVTIYFSDVVGFTALSASSTPLQVVELLNNLYTCFDSIIGHYDVYKVETIGDAYMVVSGLPIRNGDRHAGEIASLALHLLSAIQNFEIPHKPGERLKLRIGIHSGPCVAGVVGLKMPRYCLFGDTVNTASRMESTGEALKIHVSEACKIILHKLGGYKLNERGMTPIKGKGEMRTYWLLGKTRISHNHLSAANTINEINDLKEFSDSCLRETGYPRSISPDPYNLKIDDNWSNRWLSVDDNYHCTNYNNSPKFSLICKQEEGGSGESGNGHEKFRRINSCALDDKHYRKNRSNQFHCPSYHQHQNWQNQQQMIIQQQQLQQHSPQQHRLYSSQQNAQQTAQHRQLTRNKIKAGKILNH